LPNYAPDANAFAERFVRSVKSECIERRILFGEGALRRVLREYLAHYNGERNHQGIGNVLIAPLPGDLGGSGRIAVRRRLGGLLNFYRRKAGSRRVGRCRRAATRKVRWLGVFSRRRGLYRGRERRVSRGSEVSRTWSGNVADEFLDRTGPR
jgi:transposase InsO family protein